MKLTPTYRWTPLLLSWVVIGCSSQPEDKFVAKAPETIPPAVVAPGNETSLFPLDKGDQWTYSVELTQHVNGQDQIPTTYESVWTVMDSKQTDNGIEGTIQSTRPGNKTEEQHWLANSKGIYELSDGHPPVSYTPPFPLILFPVRDGTVYHWQGTGPNGSSSPGAQTSERTIRPSEIVDTDMGQMSAIPVDDIGTIQAGSKKGQSQSTVWFTPGVGIVRLVQDVDVGNSGYHMVLKLKSKSLMKA